MLAHQAAGVAPVHVRQFDIKDDQVGAHLLRLLDPLPRRARMDDLESLMQLELLGERLAQLLIVVDQQNRLGGGHV
jgi:hypothetical protein